MPIEELDIFCHYDVQRFTQFGSMDCANWYGIRVNDAKKKQALYPCMGRKHVRFLNQNRLIFNVEPRNIFRTINFFYVIEGTTVFQYDQFYNQKNIGSIALTGKTWFAFLAVGSIVYAMLTDETNIWVITENGTSVSMAPVTDPNAPGGSSTGGKPFYVAAFGSRFLVAVMDTPTYYLTRINLFSTVPDAGSLANCFTINGSPLFNQASGIIRQFGVLHAQLYIFTDYTTDIWGNIITQITVNNITTEFPWKLNSSYNWDYGIADDMSLDVDFGRMVWLGKNANGLVSFMATDGQQPQNISTQAINVLLQRIANSEGVNPFLTSNSNGFLYQYENTIFYRVSAGNFTNSGILDIEDEATSIEYNFDTQCWGRVIELNGERNRIQNHIYFNTTHLVTVQGDGAIYEMAGNIYHNELLNPAQSNTQAPNAFLKFPMRYELVTKHLFNIDYSENKDEYVEIDFVFGDKTFYESNTPFTNTTFIIDQDSTSTSPIYMVTEESEGDDNTFMITENGNTPTFDDNHYNALFKPHIELYYSDDGGVTYTTADLRPFSQLGQYRWRMRWYELGVYRNRCYKLICVSSAPIVILGAVRNTMRVSGGAN